jgi:hypothetical protein
MKSGYKQLEMRSELATHAAILLVQVACQQ